MSIILDHQLREQIPHSATEFPITYFHNELATLPNLAGPLHWHPDFEIATAENSDLDYQVGKQHIILKPGDSIFINGNILHGIRQLSGEVPEPMPNIVFSALLLPLRPVQSIKNIFILYRLQLAHKMLSEKTQTLQEISDACGFNSVNYFSRQFKKAYGYAPSKDNFLGK